MNEKPKGKFFEEFIIGDTFVSAERMITANDVKDFADLSGDHTQIHTDEDYAKATVFGERIAHGLLGLSAVSGLAAKLGFTEDTIIALRSMNWKFKKPIKYGDKIKGIFEVSEKKELRGQDSGLVTFEVRVLNQEKDLIQTGIWKMIIKKK